MNCAEALSIIEGLLKTATFYQHELEMVTLETLVPADHLVRKIAKAIDLEFIRERVAHLYCPDNGRPALDPVVLFKCLLLGYLFGIRSERPAPVCQGLEDRGIAGVMGYRRPTHRDGYFYKRQYQYDQESDSYRCPAGATLTYRTTGREGYRHYHSDPCVCMGCEQRAQCTSSANHTKVLTRHVWETAKETVDARRLTQWGKRVYQRRKETVERSFADAKQLHGHRYARLRGLAKIMEQCLLAATAQNMKKIALLLARLVAVLCAPTALSIRDTDRLVQIRPQSCQIYFCTPLSLTHLKNDKSPENLGFVSSLECRSAMLSGIFIWEMSQAGNKRRTAHTGLASIPDRFSSSAINS